MENTRKVNCQWKFSLTAKDYGGVFLGDGGAVDCFHTHPDSSNNLEEHFTAHKLNLSHSQA